MNIDLNQTIQDFEKLVQDLEKDKNDVTVTAAAVLKNAEDQLVVLQSQLAATVKDYENKIVALEAKLLTPENEQKFMDFLGRLKALISHTT